MIAQQVRPGGRGLLGGAEAAPLAQGRGTSADPWRLEISLLGRAEVRPGEVLQVVGGAGIEALDPAVVASRGWLQLQAYRAGSCAFQIAVVPTEPVVQVDGAGLHVSIPGARFRNWRRKRSCPRRQARGYWLPQQRPSRFWPDAGQRFRQARPRVRGIPGTEVLAPAGHCCVPQIVHGGRRILNRLRPVLRCVLIARKSPVGLVR